MKTVTTVSVIALVIVLLITMFALGGGLCGNPAEDFEARKAGYKATYANWSWQRRYHAVTGLTALVISMQLDVDWRSWPVNKTELTTGRK
ncbi:MAG TPA: hypothetical protein G4O12_01225 [Dehalococcoidia bacterium]|nr:hypothetical protein [Dehalococcoidia bacterium]